MEDTSKAAENTDKLVVTNDQPVILDRVDYVYASYAQVAINSLDFRIAFGDRMPPKGHVKPVIGITMSHEHAKALLKVLSENVPKIDILMQQMNESNLEKKLTEVS